MYQLAIYVVKSMTVLAMSSCNEGVQTQIRQVASLATYTHCSGHCLNRVSSKSSALPQEHNVLDHFQNCATTFSTAQWHP